MDYDKQLEKIAIKIESAIEDDDIVTLQETYKLDESTINKVKYYYNQAVQAQKVEERTRQAWINSTSGIDYSTDIRKASQDNILSRDRYSYQAQAAAFKYFSKNIDPNEINEELLSFLDSHHYDGKTGPATLQNLWQMRTKSKELKSKINGLYEQIKLDDEIIEHANGRIASKYEQLKSLSYSLYNTEYNIEEIHEKYIANVGYLKEQLSIEQKKGFFKRFKDKFKDIFKKDRTPLLYGALQSPSLINASFQSVNDILNYFLKHSTPPDCYRNSYRRPTEIPDPELEMASIENNNDINKTIDIENINTSEIDFQLLEHLRITGYDGKTGPTILQNMYQMYNNTRNDQSKFNGMRSQIIQDHQNIVSINNNISQLDIQLHKLCSDLCTRNYEYDRLCDVSQYDINQLTTSLSKERLRNPFQVLKDKILRRPPEQPRINGHFTVPYLQQPLSEASRLAENFVRNPLACRAPVYQRPLNPSDRINQPYHFENALFER